jgi:hypothetical protein
MIDCCAPLQVGYTERYFRYRQRISTEPQLAISKLYLQKIEPLKITDTDKHITTIDRS